MNTLEILGIAAAAALGGFAALVIACRGHEDPPFPSIVRALNCILMASMHRVRVYDYAGRRIREALPRTGACIVVANHRSGADPMVVARSSRRWIWFLMAREYYEKFEWFFSRIGCIPVKRDGNDLASTRQALKALKNGRVIGIFPQGGIIENDDDIDFSKAGVALLASRTGAPVIPMFIAGSPMHDNVFKATLLIPSRSRVYCGKPLEFESGDQKPTREELDAFTARLRDAVLHLRAVARGAERTVAS